MRVAAYLKETINGLHSTYPDWPMVVMATAPSAKRVTADIQSCFLHHLEMEVWICMSQWGMENVFHGILFIQFSHNVQEV